MHGLDIARFLAFSGMVIVNFNVAAHPQPDWSSPVTEIFQGRAAALFVILAGVGISISKIAPRDLILRGAILFAVGLLNMLIFPADILHYYGVYFLFAALVMGFSGRVFLWLAVGVTIAAYIALFTLNYEAGWDWDTLTYTDFWTPVGFVRNLFYNGWHPVFPWLAFVLFGLWLGRRNLARPRMQMRLIVWGFATWAAVTVFSLALGYADPELIEVVALSPIPPNPFYVAGSMGTAALVLGLCLRLIRSETALRPAALAGRQALTLYIAHILLGLVILDVMGWLSGTRSALDMLLAAIAFIALSVIYAWLWDHLSSHGPLEQLMRFLTRKGSRLENR
nr:DUF418 domain-containing protein [Sulfitobacter algicola]